MERRTDLRPLLTEGSHGGKAKKADLQAKPGSTDRVQPTSLSYEREKLLIYIYIYIYELLSQISYPFIQQRANEN